jgi:Co/Zn/Cd efflux system component
MTFPTQKFTNWLKNVWDSGLIGKIAVVIIVVFTFWVVWRLADYAYRLITGIVKLPGAVQLRSRAPTATPTSSKFDISDTLQKLRLR